MEISAYLKRGRENAISQKDLSALTGINERTLRDMIAQERKQTCICSVGGKNGGYYLPSCIQEARGFQRQEESRARAIFRGLKGTRQYIKSAAGEPASDSVPGQINMFNAAGGD